MIISRTPLRMSFAGGGSDLPDFYRRHGGAVVSSAIDKYIYVNINQKFDNGIRVAYSKTEEVASVEEIEHPIVRAALKHLEIDGGVEITTIADIPSRGTGLGSSSSFTVGLLHGLNAFKGRYVSNNQLGADGCHVEIDLCGAPIGKQDHYAAAFGGLNFLEFKPDDSVIVSPVICQRSTLRELQASLVVFYTGIVRSAATVLQRQSAEIASSDSKRGALIRMVELAYCLRDELQKDNLAAFGEILHENWMLKKSIASCVSSSDIDGWYNAARRAGAVGGKILGAGAGGFLLFFAPAERHAAIKAALPRLRPISTAFEPLGSRIIFYQ